MRAAAASSRPASIALALGSAALLLASCAAPRTLPEATALPEPAPASFAAPPPPPDSARMSCVPYARALTGLDIRGDAWTWWSGADGRYARGSRPSPHAVLVLARGLRLDRGHLAVVGEVVDARRIRVNHANWNNDKRIVKDMIVVDVSAANDWTEVKFWNAKAGSWGNVYLAYGFIYPPGTEPPGTATAQAP
ncbi:MAG: CHAP domain-containing protein [Pseudomonadota bacterium]